MIETLTIAGPEDEGLLERFHGGLYSAEFATQIEPLDIWKRALWSGETSYRLKVQLALDGNEIVGGVTSELYERSRCGLVTYVVVAPRARGLGLGKELRSSAARSRYAEGARAVFGEINDPRVPHTQETADATWRRLERYQRWGSRVVDTRYVQPSLGPGLERDRGLCLLLHAGDATPAAQMPGAIVREFVAELYELTERVTTLDAELRVMLDGIPEIVSLVELVRGRI